MADQVKVKCSIEIVDHAVEKHSFSGAAPSKESVPDHPLDAVLQAIDLAQEKCNQVITDAMSEKARLESDALEGTEQDDQDQEGREPEQKKNKRS